MSPSVASERTAADVYQPAAVVSHSHPDHLACIARLFGMQPAPIDRCRVLEIGCGLGFNLLPMAERHPSSTFVGLDRSSQALSVARRLSADAGLSNASFDEWKPGESTEALGSFDYVICHDVYSRLPLGQHDPLMAMCQARLNPQGVLYISYRALPGWLAPSALGELARLLASEIESLPERLARTRQLLQFVVESQSAEATPWGRMLKHEAALAQSLTDAALAHEHLGLDSYPVFLAEMAAHAAAHRLQYLGDADIPSMFSSSLGAAVQQPLTDFARDSLSLEQYMDLVRNQGAHQSLFCHPSAPRRQWTADRLQGLYLAGELRAEQPAADFTTTAPTRFVLADGRAFGVTAPAAKAALEAIGAAWPRSVAFDALGPLVSARLAAGAGQPATIDDSQRADMGSNLLECVANGLLEVHSDVDRFTPDVSSRPQVGAWTRLETASRETVTNRRHREVSLDEMSRNLLRFLDGTRDRAALLSVLVEAAERGQLSILRGDLPARSSEAGVILGQVLDQALERLAKSALLVG